MAGVPSLPLYKSPPGNSLIPINTIALQPLLMTSLPLQLYLLQSPPFLISTINRQRVFNLIADCFYRVLYHSSKLFLMCKFVIACKFVFQHQCKLQYMDECYKVAAAEEDEDSAKFLYKFTTAITRWRAMKFQAAKKKVP